METEKYRALMCAIETGSLTAAAERLQYTPSGISRMVAALEDETGFPLLLREHGGVRPTVEEFAREAYIETYPDADIDNARVFARCGVKPNLQFSTQDSYATYSMVEAGLGLSMNNAVNGRLWSGGVKILPLDPPQYVEIGIASRADASPAAKRFLDFLRTYLAGMHGQIEDNTH